MLPAPPSIVIHPGFLKTGTTTLQEHLFDVHPGIHLLTRDQTLQGLMSEALRAIDGMGYDDERLRSLVDDALAAHAGSRVVLYSNETLTANPYLIVPIAKRLKAVFPEARILFTLRHQIAVLESFYAAHGRMHTSAPRPYRDRHIPLRHWLEHAHRNRTTTIMGAIDYGRVLGIYESEFGAGRVHPVLFEDFTRNTDAFLRSVCTLLEIDVEEARALLEGAWSHARPSRRFVAYARLRRRFLPTPLVVARFPGVRPLHEAWRRLIRGGARFSVRIPDDWRTILEEDYRPGNRRLVAAYGLPLEKYGYPL